MVNDAKEKNEGEVLKELAENVRTMLGCLLVTYRK
jgi:hypothetical protein